MKELKHMSSIFSKIYKKFSKYLNSKIIFAMDIIASLVATLFVILIGKEILDHYGCINNWKFVVEVICFTTAIIALLFYITKSYTVIIRHATLKEIWKFSLAAFGKAALAFIILGCIWGFCNSLIVLAIADFLITMFVLIGLRVAMVLAYDTLKYRLEDKAKRQRVLVYGIGDKSVATIKRLHDSSHYTIIGFITYGEIKVDHTINNFNVYYFHNQEDIEWLESSKDADAILFAIEEDVKAEQDRLIKYAVDSKLKVLYAPSIDEIKDGKLTHPIREIQIEDLLGRPEIKISLDEIIANFKGKTVMVTGAAGSIGSELCRQLAGFGVGKLVLYDNAETPMHYLRLEIEDKWPDLKFVPIIGDVRHPKRLDFAFRTHHPDVVFHAAAYKHVPLMEENPCEAVLVNVAGSRNVANKCIEYNVEKMVMISTDKAVNPTNIMGCTKRLAEIYVQSLGLELAAGNGTFTDADGDTHTARTKFVTTRFGNVLGSNGSVIPRFRDQIAKGGPVTVTHPDITRFFMTIPEACRLVMEAATMSTGNQIFVFDMGESVKIDTLARRMIKLAGFEPDKDIKIEYSGLRPGEKLYEEVLATTENTIPTDHSRIRIAKVREYNYTEASEITDNLEELSRAVNIPDMVRLMKKTVPEFKSKNSPYEKYDVELAEKSAE